MAKENTPYDDAFRTLLVKCPTLAIPLVNEVFQEKYELCDKVDVFHNEFFIGNGNQKKRITDSYIGIGDKRYHVECQSSTDGTITVRIFEYDSQIAAENTGIQEGRAVFTFPYSVLLYLRCTSKTPRMMQVAYRVPNGCISYEIPILKVPEYTSDDIITKELYLIIPFHIFAYEKELEDMNGDSEKLESLLDIYRRFARVLQQKVEKGRLTEYVRLVIRDMTVKVTDNLTAKWPNVKEGVENIMGGAILELEVDKIKAEGEAAGEIKGLIYGMVSLVRDGLLDLAEGAKRANMTVEEFERLVGD